MKEIREYIPDHKKYICDNCMNSTCTRSCVIWADAMTAQDDDTAKTYFLKKYSRDILGYFRYFADKYPMTADTTPDGRTIYSIDIPIMDGCNSLDYYFINVLTTNGWTFEPFYKTIFMHYIQEG